MKKFLKLLITVLIILFILIKYFEIDKKILMKWYPNTYSEYVEKYAEMYEIENEVIYAIIKNESNFKNTISSSKGAQGLMQLMEATADEVALELELGEYDLSDPETNIQIGTKYFADLYAKYENIPLALAAYNAGTGTVDKWIEQGIISSLGDDIENIPYKETNMYVRKVVQTIEIYEDLYG